MSRVRVGTCTWAGHEDFYPPGTRPAEKLAYYARLFPVVEVDSTFYAVPAQTTLTRWADETPEDFRFDVKAFRALTRHGAEHRPGPRREDDPSLDPTEDEVRAFREALEPLRQAGKLGAVHFQFPPWFRATVRSRIYLAAVRDWFPRDLISIELRHRSWLADEAAAESTFRTLRELGLTYCAVDMPDMGDLSLPPLVSTTDPRLAIVRLHGRNTVGWYGDPKLRHERCNYLYAEEELLTWAASVRRLAAEADEVHVHFNNTWSNYAVTNAFDLMRLLGQDVPEQPAQLTLPL